MPKTSGRLITLLGVILSTLSPMQFALAALDYSVRVDAPPPLARLLNDYLPLVVNKGDPAMDAMLLASLVHQTPDDARKLLETEGYFNARVTVGATSGKYVVKVDAGEAVVIDDVTLSIVGPIRSDPEFQPRLAAILEAWPLPIGANYRQEDWDSGKKAVLRLLLVNRFLLAKIVKSRVDIDRDTNKARLELVLDSGPAIEFGHLSIKGLKRYPIEIAEGMADFHQGSPYRLEKLVNYQSALEQAPHFSSAVVSADLQHIQDNQIPINVELTEFPRQKLEFGLNYDSDVGGGSRIGYSHYNIFQRGYTGSIIWDWKKPEQSLTLGLEFPRRSDGYSHSLTMASKKTEIKGLVTRSLSMGGWRTRTRGKVEARLGIEYLSDSQWVIDTSDPVPHVPSGQWNNRGGTIDTHALIPSFGWTRRSIDDILRPRSGTLIDINVSGAVENMLSKATFIRGYGRSVIYWTPFAPRWGTVVGRGEAGQIWARDADIPPSLLFLAGGINSVRGYSYQDLGVPRPNGTVEGGRVLATVSLEYQIPVARDWSLALFRDAGNAAARWEGYTFKHATGVGVRWMSPVAPVAFDVAKGDKYRWYLSLGLVF